MDMQMCAKCHKRFAVVFITRIENNKPYNEGLCLQCARQLGIKPVNDMLSKIGISEEDLDNAANEMRAMLSESLPDSKDDDEEEGGAPAIELPKIFSDYVSSKRNSKNKKTKPDDKSQKRKFLTTYCQDLTQKAAEGKLDRIIGRDRELERVTQILCRRQKNNPCLIGEPGVGKTAIAEALALRIVNGQVPEKLADCEIHLVDLTALVAGTQFRGQFESRVLGLINEVKAAGNIILVIDEVHNIVGAGDAEGSMNAANILKPALSRGEIQVIGATTLKEYRKHIEKDSALERRFQPVMVNEPSVQETEQMLLGIKGYYEDYHQIRIPDEVLYEAAYLSERYITDRFLPDKVIDLLDEAAAHVSLSTLEINEKRRVERQLADVREERVAMEGKIASLAGDADTDKFYRELADLKVREDQLSKRHAELVAHCEQVALTVDDLAQVIEIWTGIPATDISRSEFAQLDTLAERIKTHIVGQDEAVDAIARAIKRKRAGVSYRRSPISMIFAGPTGVGKTELVKVLAQDLFKQPETLIRLDMSEFMEKHSVSRIIGAPPGYVGYDEAGQLTEKIRRRPYSVILFDEIEKAHPDVLNILLQVLDDGKITDASGRQVNFENTVIIMTTNAGSDRNTRVSGFGEDMAKEGKEKTEKALLTFLRPEFLNRIDSVITFRALSLSDFSRIAGIMLGQLSETLSRKNVKLTWTEEVPDFIARESFSIKFGARNMRRYIERTLEDRIAGLIIAHHHRPLFGVSVFVRDNELQVASLS